MESAYSNITPNVQRAWDASSIKAAQFCPRYYKYSVLDAWETESVDLAYGRFIADGFEAYQKLRLDGLSRDDALVQVVREALTDTYHSIDASEHTHEADTQWGGHYEDQWKCSGDIPYKNAAGRRAKCPNAFEAVWFPGDAPDVCPSCMGGTIRKERHYMADDGKKNRKSLIRALVWYAYEQPEDLAEGLSPYVFPNGQKAVELSGRLPLPWKTEDGEQYLLTYNFDYIGVFGDEKFIVDNKTTTKSLNEMYFNSWSPETQFDTYSMIATLAFPDLGISGVLVDAVQVMVNGVAFGRRPYYKTEEHHEEHLSDLEYWIKGAEAWARHDYWPMNKRSCWLCPFKQVCSQAPKMREGYLKSNFKKKPERWNPLQQR